MKIQAALIHWSRGENLGLYWKFFWWRKQCSVRIVRDMLTFFLNRMAHRHGGYIGNGAKFDRKAPQIGDHCLIGAGAVVVGGITIGDFVKIGAGAVVCTDVPSHSTVVSQPSIIIVRRTGA